MSVNIVDYCYIGVSEPFLYPYGIWQYSHTGKVNGIEGNVDMNYSYTDYPKMMKIAGLNGFGKPVEVQYRKHTVVKNESLWVIAERYLGNGIRYKEIKTLNGLKTDVIHPGQVLKIHKA